MNEEKINVQEEPVTEVTENTEAQTVEENEEGIALTDTSTNEVEKKEVKNYTEEDLEKLVNERIDEMLPRKIEREKRKIEKDYKKKLAKYEETESILSAGLGKTDIDEINNDMRNFYKDQGIDIPAYTQPKYSDEDEKSLGELDANKIIDLGFEDMQDEANRLAELGSNMTVREKAMFNKLASELTIQKNRKELARIGVKSDVLDDKNFKEFSRQFNSDVPIQNVYEMYTKLNEKPKNYDQIGSMKSTKTTSEVKEYYSPEEASKFTRKDYDRNPKLLEAVERSMTLWGK